MIFVETKNADITTVAGDNQDFENGFDIKLTPISWFQNSKQISIGDNDGDSDCYLCELRIDYNNKEIDNNNQSIIVYPSENKWHTNNKADHKCYINNIIKIMLMIKMVVMVIKMMMMVIQ